MSKLSYCELICTTYIKESIPFHKTFEVISKYLNFSMSNCELKEFHSQKGYKHYNFGGFLPLEKEKLYKKGKTYNFIFRSFDRQFIEILSKALRENINNPNMVVVQTTKKIIEQSFIDELYSATPVITTLENGRYWSIQESGDIVQLQKQLHDNLEKKYNSFFEEKLQVVQNFIQLLEIKNRVPQNIRIEKDGHKIIFFGNKFKIVPNEEEVSQKLAFTVLACGLGEKNSYGGGFCLGK